MYQLFNYMKLLQEVSYDLLTETVDKNLYVGGIFMEMGIVNKNKRHYHPDVVGPIVEQYIKDCVLTGSAVGEADHPNNPNLNIDRISHRIVELKREGNNYVGKALVLDTPMGNVVRGLIKGGVRTAMSTRAMGNVTVTSEGIEDVGAPFMMVTVGDFVMSPSAPNAFMQAVNESANWVMNAQGTWVSQIVENFKKDMEIKPLAEIHRLKLEAFQNFLQTIGSK